MGLIEGMTPGARRRYLGASGQMAVMAELLDRGCNVAVPEVDTGEDVFAFAQGEQPPDRIQVKRSTAKRRSGGHYVADIKVPLRQLESVDSQLFFAFAIRLDGRWIDFVVISRYDLYVLVENEGIGSLEHDKLMRRFQLVFEGDDALRCGGCDLNRHRNAWGSIPALTPPAGEETPLSLADDTP